MAGSQDIAAALKSTPQPVQLCVYVPGTGVVALKADTGDAIADAAGFSYAGLRLGLENAPNRYTSSATAFWNAAVVGAGGFSAAYNTLGQWGKAHIYVTSSVANTITVQYSLDGVNWFDLTQDNAGTLFIIALVAGHLSAVRDLPLFPGTQIRLIAVGASTLTAGIELCGI